MSSAKYLKYKLQHNEPLKCIICARYYRRNGKYRHYNTKYHKLVLFLKKKMLDYNNYGELHKKTTREIVK